jgi:hypothetical protein
MNHKTTVYARLSIEGIHGWDGCYIDEVSYLKYPHRHRFGIKATVDVTHADRDVEFIELAHSIKEYLNGQYYNTAHKCLVFGSMSCEMIASELLNQFDLVECEVNEDEECGATVTRTS